MTTLAEDYLVWSGGSVSEYHFNLTMDQRLGQAFFNALSGADQEKLRYTTYDPFNKFSSSAIETAINFLLFGGID